MTDQEKIRVIFICTGNSCRSQMAEGYLRHVAGDRFEIFSAGSSPETDVARLAIQVMHEIDIDISHHMTKLLDIYTDEPFDWVITLCDHARDFCPIFRGGDQGVKKLHWSIKDPYKASNDPELELKAYRNARDDITSRIKSWLNEEFDLEILD